VGLDLRLRQDLRNLFILRMRGLLNGKGRGARAPWLRFVLVQRFRVPYLVAEELAFGIVKELVHGWVRR